MFDSVKLLEIYLDDKQVGRLALSPDRLALFEYDTDWLLTGFSISPFYLPLKAGLFTAKAEPFNGMFGVFEDSLPDGWGKLLVDRWLISRGIRPGSLSLLDRLSIVGESGMGALTYHPAQSTTAMETLHELKYYADEVEKVLNNDYSGSIEDLLIRAGSSGGARPKVLVNIDGEEWLVKFKSSVDPENVGEFEYKYSLLAKKCGIIMTETRLLEGKYFGIRRFDRVEEKRIHMHSAAGLLYAGHRLPSLDYADLLKATMALTRDITEVEKIFRQMVFNILINNKDDHAKNFSFLCNNGHWQVSPAYDLLPSDGFNGNHSTTVNGKGHPLLTDCLATAKAASLPLKNANSIIMELSDIIKNTSLP